MKKIIYLFLFALTILKVQAQHISFDEKNMNSSLTYSSKKSVYDLSSSQNDISSDENTSSPLVDNKIYSFQHTPKPAPDIIFIAATGDSEYDAGRGIAVDKSGNIYVTGYYANAASFGVENKRSNGEVDFFVAKYNKSGVLQWAQSVGGYGNDYGESIAVDGNGNVYMTGTYSKTIKFGTITKTPKGWFDVFIIKFDKNGKQQWVQTVNNVSNGKGMTSVNGIILDKNNNLYITGTYNGNVALGTDTKASKGDDDIFIAKYTSNGDLKWVQSVGGSDREKVYGIAIDSKENVYITGSFLSQNTFDSNAKTTSSTFGSIVQTSKRRVNIFLAKYDQIAEKWSWVQLIGGDGRDDQSAYGIAIDGNDNIYLTGYYNGPTTFGSTEKISKVVSDIFLAKYDTKGNMHWIESAGGEKEDYSVGIAVDHTGNVYLTGSYDYTAKFGTITKTAKYGGDFFIAKYNPLARAWEWVQSAGGSGGLNTGRGIAVDSQGRAHVTGQFSGTCTFGNTTKTAKGATDIFVIKLAQ